MYFLALIFSVDESLVPFVQKPSNISFFPSSMDPKVLLGVMAPLGPWDRLEFQVPGERKVRSVTQELMAELDQRGFGVLW